MIGGGAAGLMAAASAAKSGRQVLLLEKNKKFGVKILMSGGTRCNITHNCDSREIVAAFGRQGKFLHSALAALPPHEVVELFESLGVATKTESTGKIFPVSNRAIDVRDALVRFATSQGCTLQNNSPVTGLARTENGFVVSCGEQDYFADAVILTTGGLSFPGCGTTGDGYAWAESLGHSIVDTTPALTPLLSNCDWANELKGLTLNPACVEVWPPSKGEQGSNPTPNPKPKSKKKAKPLMSNTGSFLFTHFGFSGPAPMNVSGEIAKHPDKKKLQLKCDFFPDQSPQQMIDQLSRLKKEHGSRSVFRTVNESWPEFPRRLVEQLIAQAGIDPSIRLAELSADRLKLLVDQMKSTTFPLQGTLGYEKAEVTSGGVDLSEVSSSTLESKLCPGLFFAGEILNLDGPIGGFNFQAAWSTGWLAGQSVMV